MPSRPAHPRRSHSHISSDAAVSKSQVTNLTSLRCIDPRHVLLRGRSLQEYGPPIDRCQLPPDAERVANRTANQPPLCDREVDDLTPTRKRAREHKYQKNNKQRLLQSSEVKRCRIRSVPMVTACSSKVAARAERVLGSTSPFVSSKTSMGTGPEPAAVASELRSERGRLAAATPAPVPVPLKPLATTSNAM